MDDAALQEALMEAHRRGDHLALAQLYTEAADRREAVSEIDAACFFLTHAFVFALEQGADEVQDLRKRLAALGRVEDD